MGSSEVSSDHRDDGTVVLTLNRPGKRNALTISLMQSLCDEIKSLEQKGECRVIVLCGAGAAFCSGLDLDEASDTQVALQSAECVARTFQALSSSPLVSIAAVHGAAMAGGAGLMASCDFVVASEDLRIGFPEVRRGLVPALAATQLRDRLRDSELQELILLAEPIDARRAMNLGLVHRVVSQTEMMNEAFRIAECILRGAPQAIQRTKKMIRDLRHGQYSEAIQLCLAVHTAARSGTEASEGIAAFLEKRDPRW